MIGRFDRQSFLGPDSQRAFEDCTVAVIGLGGGGSHIAQQLAHLGFLRFQLFDPDKIEETNLNRLIGGEDQDVAKATPKVEISRRLITRIAPGAMVEPFEYRWQDRAEDLRRADVIFGCVDGFREREELERMARRFLLPLIDIGLDVTSIKGNPPRMAGQIVVSVPGEACMRCLRFIDEKVLTQEAARYGNAGTHPQVVFANGVLASAAVGAAVNLLSGWTGKSTCPYLVYDGNDGTLTPSLRLENAPKNCAHFGVEDVGLPRRARVTSLAGRREIPIVALRSSQGDGRGRGCRRRRGGGVPCRRPPAGRRRRRRFRCVLAAG